MEKFSGFIDKALRFLIATCLAVMSCLIFGNVVLRQVFNSGITWAEEMSRYLFIWLVFLGAILALKNNQHIVVDLFVNKLSPKFQKYLGVATRLVIIFILLLILDGSWRFTVMNMNSYSPAVGMPLSLYYGIGVLAAAAMILILLNQIFRIFKKRDETL